MRNVHTRILITAAGLMGLTACSNGGPESVEPEPYVFVPGEVGEVTPIELPEIPGGEPGQQPTLPEVTPPSSPEQPSGVMTVTAGYIDLAESADRGVGPEVIVFDELTHLFVGYADVADDGECYFEEDPTDALAVIDELATEDMDLVLSVRTWESDGLLNTATDEAIRQRFISTCAELVEDLDLDGLDLAFPQVAGQAAVDDVVAPDNPAYYSELVSDLRGRLGTDAILTIALPAGEQAGALVGLDTIGDDVDWVNVPAYDFDAGAADETSLFAPIDGPEGALLENTVANALDVLAAQGLPYEKMVLGVSFRGRVYGEVEPGNTDGMFQFFRDDTDTIPFAEIADALGAPDLAYNAEENSISPWIYDASAKVVVAFDDGLSVAAKRDLAEATALRGMFAYDITADDAAHTLHRAIAGR